MPQLKTDIYTTDYIYSLPDGQHAELIDGVIYDMAPPNRIHQEVSGELYRAISNYIHSNNGSYKVYAAPFAVFLNADDKNTLNQTFPLSAIKTNLQIKAVMVSRALLLK